MSDDGLDEEEMTEIQKIQHVENLVQVISKGISPLDASFPFSKLGKIKLKSYVRFKKNIPWVCENVLENLNADPFFPIKQGLLGESWIGETPSLVVRVSRRFFKAVEIELNRWEKDLMFLYAKTATQNEMEEFIKTHYYYTAEGVNY